MGLALALLEREGEEPVLRALAEAASDNDPAFNHSHQVLAVAAGADLLPHLPEHARQGGAGGAGQVPGQRPGQLGPGAAGGRGPGLIPRSAGSLSDSPG